MSIIRPDDLIYGPDLAEKDCFYCYKKFSGVAIFWMGSNGDLWLHPECLLKLAVRMFRDVHEEEITVQDWRRDNNVTTEFQL